MADKADDPKPLLIIHDFPDRRTDRRTNDRRTNRTNMDDWWLHFGNVKQELADGVMGPEEERLWWEAHRAQQSTVLTVCAARHQRTKL